MRFGLRDLHHGLSPDPWRTTVPFSPDFEDVHAVLQANVGIEDRARALRAWLGRYQPCLFGRAAAKLDLLSFCVLDEHDLERGDAHVRDTIQQARMTWLQTAAKGEKHGFIVFLATPTLARALPDDVVRRLANRLCSLYLMKDVGFDSIELEHIYLDVPDYQPKRFRWAAGVNYFSAHADGRWWHDHRIPGGIGFSVNSVGHMVFASKTKKAFDDLRAVLDMPTVEAKKFGLQTLEEALVMAMRTIANAQDTVSGKATCLLEASAGERVPFQMPADLKGASCVKYSGYYHTDFTLPSEYFVGNVERDPRAVARDLDLTYLWNADVENVDHVTMGTGIRIAGAGREDERLARMKPDLVDDEDIPNARLIFG